MDKDTDKMFRNILAIVEKQEIINQTLLDRIKALEDNNLVEQGLA